MIVRPFSRRGFVAGLLSLLVAFGWYAGPTRAQESTVIVFAAASLKNALDEIASSYAEATGGKITVSYAASSALAKQIEQGAPAEVFISADLDWMDYLAQRHLIKPDSRFNLVGNTLVLVTSKPGQRDVALGPGLDLGSLVGDGRLAVGGVEAVPAGRYAKAALEKLGAWNGVASKLAPAENVRAALALVRQGEAEFGIVYRTDAVAEPGVRVIGTFPADSHPPIIYPAALTANAPEAAARFLGYLRNAPEARGAFARQGFEFLSTPSS